MFIQKLNYISSQSSSLNIMPSNDRIESLKLFFKKKKILTAK